jgi:NDP-sugar pyrophosphorylase family protein
MKVVRFCGGYGMRLRNSADDGRPKPMQIVGPRPLLWHVMRHYAHFGHKEFVLCLGYGAGHTKLLPDVSGSRIERFRDARRPSRADAFRY